MIPNVGFDDGGPICRGCLATKVVPSSRSPGRRRRSPWRVSLSQQGSFTWKEWATTLADELKAAADRGEPDDGSRYYEHWLAALVQRLVTAKRLTKSEELRERQAQCAGVAATSDS